MVCHTPLDTLFYLSRPTMGWSTIFSAITIGLLIFWRMDNFRSGFPLRLFWVDYRFRLLWTIATHQRPGPVCAASLLLAPRQLTLCSSSQFILVPATMDKEDEELSQEFPVQDSRTLVTALARELRQAGIAASPGASAGMRETAEMIDREMIDRPLSTSNPANQFSSSRPDNEHFVLGPYHCNGPSTRLRHPTFLLPLLSDDLFHRRGERGVEDIRRWILMLILDPTTCLL